MKIFLISFALLLSCCIINAQEIIEDKNASWVGQVVVRRDQRAVLARTEHGMISAVEITDGIRGPYLLHFFTLEPNSLFLPVLLHADMVFYVHTGSGTLSWTDEDRMRNVNIRRGDIHTIPTGSLFYLQSNLEPERQKLRIYAIFSNTVDGVYDSSVGAYSSIRDLVVGFDRRVLQAAFKVPEEVLDEITSVTKPPPIVHAVSQKKSAETLLWELEARFLKSFIGGGSEMIINKKKKPKRKALNIFDRDPDFKNCNGWSTTVNREDLSSLGESNVGVFMVNLTKGSMMGPHWNPSASEMAIVLHGEGMIRVVCSANSSGSHCRNMRFRVEEGDVFAVPRFHPMAQMSFNNDSFVFMGFSTSTRRNYPQFLAGKSSVLRALDRHVLAVSFNVANTTIDQLLAAQLDSIILDCTSCAEEEESIMEAEIKMEKEREEEAKGREEEEEARRREEEEARKRKEEEEEARRREEEDKRKEEEERQREEEEAQKREEEEEARKREEEEERRRQEEAEEERRRQEEARRREKEERREEGEARKREEEEAKRREEEEARRREEEEAKREEEERRRQEEAEEERRHQEEEARRREEEEAKRKEEEAMRREEEEEARKWEQEEAKRREEEETRRREAERRRQEEEAEEEGAKRREEEAERRREEEEGARREQEEAKREYEERQRKERQEEERRREEAGTGTGEQEQARREYEERQRRARREEETAERQRREGDERGGGGYEEARKLVKKVAKF